MLVLGRGWKAWVAAALAARLAAAAAAHRTDAGRRATLSRWRRLLLPRATYRALSPALRRRRAGRLLDAYEAWLAAAEASAWRSAALCGVILEQPNRRLKAALGRWAALLQRRELAAVCDEAAAVRELVHYWLQWRDWWAARLRVATSAEAGKVLCAWRGRRAAFFRLALMAEVRVAAHWRAESARRAAGLLRTVRGWRHWVREWQGVRRKERHLQVGSAHRLIVALIKAWICWRALRGLAAALRMREDVVNAFYLGCRCRAAIAAMRRAAAEKRVVSAIRLLDGGPSAVVVRVEVRGLAPLREAEVGTMYARSRK